MKSLKVLWIILKRRLDVRVRQGDPKGPASLADRGREFTGFPADAARYRTGR